MKKKIVFVYYKPEDNHPEHHLVEAKISLSIFALGSSEKMEKKNLFIINFKINIQGIIW